MGRLIDTDDLMQSICAEYNRRFLAGDRGGLKLAWIEKAVNDTPDAVIAGDKKRAYWCNGLKPDCSKSNCYFLGNGDCMQTFDERYAIRRQK
jgi:hypothetical protein